MPTAPNATDDLLAAFRQDVAATKPADSNTPRTYEWGARTLCEYMAASQLPLQGFGETQYLSFAVWLAGRGWTANAVRTAAKGARAFLRWAASRGLRQATDLGRPPLPSVPERQPVHLTKDRLVDYLGLAAQQREPIRTVLLMLPMTGCRIRELCGAPMAGLGREGSTPVMRVRRKGAALSFAQVGSFDRDQCTAYLPAVGLNPAAYAAVHSYLTSYRTGVSGSPWLFPALANPSNYLPPNTVREELRRMRLGLGLPWLTPHRAGRHTLAMLLRDDGMPIDKIADILGHASIETTRSVYARASPAEVAALSGRAFQSEEER